MWMMLIGAAIGGVAGILSTHRQGQRQRSELERQRESAWSAYEFGRQYSDSRFSMQKSEALENLGVQRKNLDTQLDMSIDDFNTNLLGQAFGMQDARIQTGSAIGASLAAEGASGTRGSSSGDMMRAYAAQSLERNIELANRQNSGNLNRMVTGANTALHAINREEASWMPGGYRMQEKEAQDFYNLNIANLGQSDFDWRISHSQPGAADYLTGMFQGGSAGYSMGNSWNNFTNELNRDAWFNIGKR